jgi:hypothetical protein
MAFHIDQRRGGIVYFWYSFIFKRLNPKLCARQSFRVTSSNNARARTGLRGALPKVIDSSDTRLDSSKFGTRADRAWWGAARPIPDSLVLGCG